MHPLRLPPTVSIAVVVWLERALGRDTDIARLTRGQLGQLHAQLFKMQRRYFLVQVFGQHVDFVVVVGAPNKQFYLREHLIGEAC